MRTLGLVGGLSMILLAGPVRAQEPTGPAEDEARAADEASRPEPRLRIRVLEHPYDLASFYRSAGPEARSPFDFSDRYPIASFYRARGGVHPQGYSRFWTNGYASGAGYRRRIGENGDLFLLAPTFLAPLGPLTGAFFDDRR